MSERRDEEVEPAVSRAFRITGKASTQPLPRIDQVELVSTRDIGSQLVRVTRSLLARELRAIGIEIPDHDTCRYWTRGPP